MNFAFTADQINIRQVAREFLSGECPPAKVKQLNQTDAGYDSAMWQQMAELGLMGINVPEAYGGGGLGAVELALVLEEMGRASCPSPYFATVVLAGTAIQAGGTDGQKSRYLPGIANGELKATLALTEEDLSYSAGGVKTTAAKSGDGWTLNGVKAFVPYAEAADLLLVPARTGAGKKDVTLFVVERGAAGLTIATNRSTDLSQRDATVTLNNVKVAGDRLIGDVNGGWPAVKAALQAAAVGSSAEMLGAARKAHELATEYAKVRKQFDQFIGSFQAIKHKASECLMSVENAHAATYYAAWALDASPDEAPMASAVAKACVSDSTRHVAGETLQIHGGIGFTWDHDLHLLMKRIYHNGVAFGDADFWRERALSLRLAAA